MPYRLKPEKEAEGSIGDCSSYSKRRENFVTDSFICCRDDPKHLKDFDILGFWYRPDGKEYEHGWQECGWSVRIIRCEGQIMVEFGDVEEISAHMPESATGWDHDYYPFDEVIDCARHNIGFRTKLPLNINDVDYNKWRFYYDTIIKYTDEYLEKI